MIVTFKLIIMKTRTRILIVLLLLVVFIIGCENKKEEIKTNLVLSEIPSESDIRSLLGIPNDAKRVLILSHAAHMDWDWLNPFPYNVDKTGASYSTYPYFNGTCQPADSILSLATQNLKDPDYYYSVCEMGFLRAFARNNPNLFDQMKASERLRIVGGGITSPDNLLPNGEAFFRNFLVANQWLDSVQVQWSNQVWVPDDFGHDPQLPVMLNAMDAMGVGFARIPGACDGNPQKFSEPKSQLLDPTTGGVDFVWQADDGSEVIAHWLEAHYSQGAEIDSKDQYPQSGGDFASPQAIDSCGTKIVSTTTVGHINSYIGANGPVSPTPYIYVHVSNDFMIPYQTIVKDAVDWNNDPNGYSKTGVYVVVATFDEYTRLVNSHRNLLKTRTYNPKNTATEKPFSPNPYWMGYYSSRPELKILHNEATRKLLGVESFQVMANTLLNSTVSQKQNESRMIYNAWDSLAASTHHDFITGTALDGVYKNEQLPILNNVVKTADNLRTSLLGSITNQLTPATNKVVVFNQLGMDNQGIIPFTDASGIKSYINVSAPSIGYKVQDISTVSKGNGTLKYNRLSNGDYTLQNSRLIMTIDNTTSELKSVYDKTLKQEILSGAGNSIEFFNDGGDIYRFGYEGPSYCSNFGKDTSASFTVNSITTNVSNDLHMSIEIKRQYKVGGNDAGVFTIVYSLRQDEPMIRISTTGQSPAHYSVMTKFPLVSNITSMDVGTPYHWNTVYPMPYGTNNNSPFNSTMWATHDFVIPKSTSTTPLAAIYHKATPAWTSNGNNLYGVILRNTPNGGSCNFNYGAHGSDYETHTQTYALRIPSGLSLPDTNMPLKEARQFNTPMQAMAIPSAGGGNLPSTYSVASPSQGNAIITAAKWGSVDTDDLVLRISEASNMSTTQSITVNKSPKNCYVVTALEKPFINSKNIPKCTLESPNSIQVKMPNSVATIKLKY